MRFHRATHHASSSALPDGWAALAGIVLGVSGQLPVLLIALALWFVLKTLRPDSSKNLIVATSLFVSTSLMSALSSLNDPTVLLVVFGVLIFSLVFFSSGYKWLGLPIIAYSMWLIWNMLFFFQTANRDEQQFALGNIFLYGFIISFTILFLLERSKAEQDAAANP